MQLQLWDFPWEISLEGPGSNCPAGFPAHFHTLTLLEFSKVSVRFMSSCGALANTYVDTCAPVHLTHCHYISVSPLSSSKMY